MTRGMEIRECVRVGARSATELVTVHLALCDSDAPPRVAFVVGKRVGGSVVRHRVQRRLRHQVMTGLSRLPDGARVVVRANPPAAAASSAELGRDLVRAMGRAAEKAGRGR